MEGRKLTTKYMAPGSGHVVSGQGNGLDTTTVTSGNGNAPGQKGPRRPGASRPQGGLG
jgi:hypothetical protein